jgi:DNA-binding transcriptional LysR family regulator
MLRDAAIAGIGIALLPTFICHAGVASGALQIIDIGIAAESAEIFIAYPADRGPSAKIRALTAHLQQAFGNPPYWEEEMPRPPDAPSRKKSTIRTPRR